MIRLYLLRCEKSYAIIRRTGSDSLPISPLPSGKTYDVIATAYADTSEEIVRAQKRFSTFFQEYTVLNTSDKINWRTVRHQFRNTFEEALLKKFYSIYQQVDDGPDVDQLRIDIAKLRVECEDLKVKVHDLKIENYKL